MKTSMRLILGSFTSVVFTGLFLISSFTVKAQCNVSFDNVNLARSGDFDQIPSLSNAPSSWANEPDCFIRISTPDLETDINGTYNHKSIKNLSMKYGSGLLADGLWGELHSPVVSGQDYVISCMIQSPAVGGFLNNPNQGVSFHFDNNDLPNTVLPFPPIPAQSNCLPFVLPANGLHTSVILPSTEIIASGVIIGYLYQPMPYWTQENVEFTADASYLNYKFYPNCNSVPFN